MTEDALATGPTTHEGRVVAGKFRLDHVLGEGGMGVVYAATNLDLFKRVAIKIIRDELGTSEGLVARMLHEARSAARLESEHVARVLDVGRMDSGAPYIVMECLDGSDLATHLHASGALPVETAVLYLLQACEAVAEAHAAGILHCDIKPENLFLSCRADGESILKVLDFGIARNLTAHAKTAPNLPEDVVGSPSYMAPEAMRPDVCVGPAADIWSLGAVLYELLTAQKPFDADRVADIFERVMNTQPAPPRVLVPSLPEGLEAIILRCLTKKEEARFASVADLAAALAPFGPPGSAAIAARVARIGASTVPRSLGLRSVGGQTRRQAPRHLGTVSSVRRRSKLRLFASVLAGAALASCVAWLAATRWLLSERAPGPPVVSGHALAVAEGPRGDRRGVETRVDDASELSRDRLLDSFDEQVARAEANSDGRAPGQEGIVRASDLGEPEVTPADEPRARAQGARRSAPRSVRALPRRSVVQQDPSTPPPPPNPWDPTAFGGRR